MKYSDLQLKSLATNNPEELIQIMNSPNADVKMLVSGAELLGSEIKEEQVVCPIFKKLLSHMNVLVREASIIGIIEFYISNSPPHELLEKIKHISETDPSFRLRSYAKDTLEDFNSRNV